MNSQRQIVKSPLLLPVMRGDLAEVESLVRAGADVNKATKVDGITPLLVAAAGGFCR